MIKILVIDDHAPDGVSFWRNIEPFSVLRKQFPGEVFIENANERVSVHDIKQFDIVVMFRPVKPESLKFIKNCRALGLRVILDIDDDLWNLPYYHPSFMDYERFKATAREIYDVADVIWTSTEQLRYVIGDLSKTEVMPNAVLPQWLPDQPSEYKGRAAWIGSAGLQYDLNGTHAQKWFEEWQEQYRQWLFFGYRPEIASGPNCTGVPYGFVYEFFESIVNAGLNVVWKPLRDLPFNHAKSNIAWLTATMAGGVCVTNFAGRDGWECALPEFTTDPAEIADNFHKSRAHILQHYNLLTVNERRLESIKSLLTGKKTTA